MEEKRKKNWYSKGGYKSVMFITATPNSELRGKLQAEISKTDIKITVIEKSGKKVVRHLQRNNPFKEDICTVKEKCLVCSGPNPGSCRETGVSYRIDCCGECTYVYTGQTGLNAYTRGKKHDQDYKANRDESALWKHCVSVHNAELQVFKLSVVDKCRNDPTKRKILESVRLQKVPVERVMTLEVSGTVPDFHAYVHQMRAIKDILIDVNEDIVKK